MNGPAGSRGWFGPPIDPGHEARLGAIARPARFLADEVVAGEGTLLADLGILRTGRLALRLFVPGRGRVTILTVEPGDVFNWSVLVPPYRASSTVVAVEPSEASLYDAVALRRTLDEDPILAAAVYPGVLAAVSRRLQATRTQLLDLFAGEGGAEWR